MPTVARLTVAATAPTRTANIIGGVTGDATGGNTTASPSQNATSGTINANGGGASANGGSATSGAASVSNSAGIGQTLNQRLRIKFHEIEVG